MRPLLALLVALLPSACAAPPERAAGAVDTVDTVEADVALLVRRLSVRHPDADCAAMTAGLGAPGPALRRAVEQADGPPWVPILASRCAVRGHAAAEEEAIRRWVTDPAFAGVARVVVRELAAVPDEPVVLRLGAAALTGPERERAALALAADARPAVRALADR